MTTSNHVAASAFGSPNVLRVFTDRVADLGERQVQLRVHAAGVNPVDWKCYSGEMGSDESRLPLRIGAEVAGVVHAVGSSVTAFAPGDEVIAFRIAGGYAERLNVPEASLFPKPQRMSWAAAAGLMLAGTTAVQALSATDVGPQDTLLVHGAAGGVGSMLVQLAHIRGAQVIGTASEVNHDYVASLGAVPVGYGDNLEDRIRGLGTPTVAIDTVGSDEALDTSVRLVGQRSRIATVVATAMSRERNILAVEATSNGVETRLAARSSLVDHVAADRLHVEVSATFLMEDASLAHKLSQKGHVRGKLALLTS